MGVRLEDLPESTRLAVQRQLAKDGRKKRHQNLAVAWAEGELEEEEKKQCKYHNCPTEVKGLRFDSQKEARRYEELMLLASSREISDLRLQVDFTLQEAYTLPSGERIRAIRYRADFTYLDQAGALVVEDVKSAGTRTKEYLLKKKLLQDKFNIMIREV